MPEFTMIVAFAVAAFLIAWLVNGFIGLLSGEKPRDTAEVFLKIFASMELGPIGQSLDYFGLSGRRRKWAFFFALLLGLILVANELRESRTGDGSTRPNHKVTNVVHSP